MTSTIKTRPKSHKLYYILSKKPTIIVAYESLESIEQMSELIKQDRAYFIIVFKWTMEDEKKIEKLGEKYVEYKEKYPGYEITFLCNTLAEYDWLGKYNLPRIFCNQNALLDEDVYRICPKAAKKYDAVYNGQIEPFKRHHLAQRVKSLALITYTLYYKPIEAREKYFYKVKELLPWAIMLNWVGHPRFEDCDFDPLLPRIPAKNISTHLNLARVGLILSKEEGACWAACEYLLSGLPVVSTKSKGGRDILFDDEYAAVVEDTPEAVEEGVRKMVERNIPAEYIRKKTLEKLKAHRQRFIALVNGIYREEGMDNDFEDEWHNVFINRMMRAQSWPGNFASEVNRSF